MSAPRQHVLVHTHTVAAPAGVVYGLVADTTRWPVIFGPTVHVHHLERSPGRERFQMWAYVNGEVKTWISRRTLDEAQLCIRFQQERSQAAVASMGGQWLFRPLPGGRTEVVLEHHLAAVDDDAEAVQLLTAAVNRNSPDELAVLGRVAELGYPIEEIVFSFEDSVPVTGSAADAYRFVHRADLWPTRLPHVNRVDLQEEQPGIQNMEMDTVTPDGLCHTTRSVRLCFPEESIVYKQLTPPAMLLGHSGAWRFGAGGTVTATHMVALDPAAVRGHPSPATTVADARAYFRQALGANSRTTLSYAGTFTPAASVPAGEDRPPS